MALTPLYFQVEKKLREKISESEMVNEKGALPNEGELCKIFGVSRITIRKALDDLVLDGLISRKAGKGTFVLPKRRNFFSVHLIGNFDELMTRGVQSKMRLHKQEIINASPDIREKLELEDEEKVYFYEGMRQIGTDSYCFFNIYVPFQMGRFFTRQELKDKKTIFNLIEEKTGTQIIEADQIITACIVSKKVSEFLKLKKGEAILSTERIYFSQQRKPVEVAISYYRPDLYQYEAKLIKRNYYR